MANIQIYKEDSTLKIVPSSLTSYEINELKELCMDNLKEPCSEIDMDLSNVSKIDIAGLQFIKSIENYTLVNGIELQIKNIPDVITDRLSILGVVL